VIGEEKLKTFTLKDFTSPPTVERLRSQTLFYLERDPLVDADFTLQVSNVVNVEANTFEAERMRNFIAYCWENKFADDLSMMYQQFVGSLVEHIINKFGHMRRSGMSKIELSRDQIFVSSIHVFYKQSKFQNRFSCFLTDMYFLLTQQCLI